MSNHIEKKPRIKLTGIDGNIFALTGIASRALKKVGLAEEAKEMQAKIIKSHSYDEALGIISDYVEAY